MPPAYLCLATEINFLALQPLPEFDADLSTVGRITQRGRNKPGFHEFKAFRNYRQQGGSFVVNDWRSNR